MHLLFRMAQILMRMKTILLEKHIQIYSEDEVDGTVKTTWEGHVISTVYKFSL